MQLQPKCLRGRLVTSLVSISPWLCSPIRLLMKKTPSLDTSTSMHQPTIRRIAGNNPNISGNKDKCSPTVLAPEYWTLAVGTDYKILTEISALAVANYKHKLAETINWVTKLTYVIPNKSIGKNDVNWDMMIDIKINKILTRRLTTHFIYDDDIKSVESQGYKSDVKVPISDVLSLEAGYTF